jgi:tetratricopeptide (TPR) repeat protein
MVLNKMLETFPEKEIEIMMQKASIYKRKKDLNTGLEIIEDLLKKYSNNIDLMSFKAFWFQYLDRKEEALEIIENLIKKNPDNGIYYDNYGEILMYFEEYEEAIKKFLKSLVLKSDQWYLYQTYIKLGICYESLGYTELAFKNLNKGKELTEKSSIDPDVKQKWLQIADLFLKNL